MKKFLLKTISIFLVVLLTFATSNLGPVDISLSIRAEAASFSDINNSSVFIKGTSGRCTLASAVMMVRRTAMANGNTNWASITENSMKSAAWIDGQGLRRTFSYSGISVKHAYLSANIDNATELIDILNNHPEGVVLYNADYPHAILLTDYTGGIFYCADPDLGPSKGRIPINEAYKQKVTINNADRYWYVDSPKVTLTHTHNYTLTKTVPATCTSDGYKYFSCNCGLTKTEKHQNALGHSYNTFSYNESAHPHYKVYSCSRGCGATQRSNETSYIDSCDTCNHKHNYTVYSTQQPTCTSDGIKYYSCRCGEVKTEKYQNPLGHSYATFSYSESAHPHYKVYSCSRGCGATQKSGETSYNSSCVQCNPSAFCANLGDDFYGLILNTSHWKPISKTEGTNTISLQTENGSSMQKWRFQRQSDGAYVISSCYDGTVLEMTDGKRELAGEITSAQDGFWGGYYQQWYLIPQGNGYVLLNKHYPEEQWVLDLSGNNSKDGMDILSYPRNNSDAQIWSVYNKDEVQLQPANLSASVEKSKVTFTWPNAYGASSYSMKLFTKEMYENNKGPYTTIEDVKSGYSVELSPGTYYAYIDSEDYYEYIMSNLVMFTISKQPSSDSKSVTITLNANGGTVNVEKVTVEAGKKAELPKPVRENYIFEGWFTTEDGGTEITSSTVFDKDVTLYAHWKDPEDLLSISANEVTVQNGQSVFIKCEATLIGSDIYFRYNVPNTEIVKANWVSGTTILELTALSIGECEVEVILFNNNTGEIHTQKSIAVKSIEPKVVLDKNLININYKKTTTINATSDYDVVWESSNPSIVSVDENGKIRVLGSGNTIIRATVTDENGNTYTSECLVKSKYTLWQLFILFFLFGIFWY